MAAGNISIQLGLRGKCTNVVTACASGTHCIGDAFRAIQYDDADIIDVYKRQGPGRNRRDYPF